MCRKELEKQFSQRLEEVEARFNGDQEAVSERVQVDLHKLEQHYQSQITGLAQQHAADRALWEEESEAAGKEMEQQWKLLKEGMDLEKEEFRSERQSLELAHTQDIKALTDKNVQLQTELEAFASAAQTKEIDLSRQLNELHNQVQERMEAKDLLLAQTENKVTELEKMLKQAVDDFIQEREELQRSLSALESRRGEVLSFQSMEMMGTIQEDEELLYQELKDERQALLAERDALTLRVVHLEEIFLQLTGSTGEPCAEPLGETCTAESSIEGSESSAQLNQDTCPESIDKACPVHIISLLVNQDGEEEVGVVDVVSDVGDPELHKHPELGVTNDRTSNSCCDVKLVMAAVEPNNSGSEIIGLKEEKEKTTKNLDVVVDGYEDAILSELQNAKTNSRETQKDESLEMVEGDVLNGTEIEAQISEEFEPSYIQESLGHHESPSTDDKSENENHSENNISIACINGICTLTTANKEEDKVADLRDVCLQEILDLQETVIQYSKTSETTTSRLKSPKLQDLEEENIIKQVPKRLEEVVATFKDVQLANLKVCFEQSIQENLQLMEHNMKLEQRVKSLEDKMHMVQDFHMQQASALEETTLLQVENSKLKVLLQEFVKQGKALQLDSDSSNTLNNSSCNSEMKEKIAAVAELEFFCMEFEKQNSHLRQALADLQSKSFRIHTQMQERRYHVMVFCVLLQ